jgi:hypothetical protein
MAQKLSRNKRKALGIRIKPQEGWWISYQLKLKGLNCTTFAARLGVRETTVSSILNGHRKSARIEDALYQTLGYPSFEDMIAASRGKGEIL